MLPLLLAAALSAPVIIDMNRAGFWIAPLLLAAFLFQILHDVKRAPRWGKTAA